MLCAPQLRSVPEPTVTAANVAHVGVRSRARAHYRSSIGMANACDPVMVLFDS